MSASGPVLPSWDRSLLSPRTLKGNGLQICKVQAVLGLLESFWWKTAFYLPNIRPENSTGAPRTALAAFTSGVLHLMARIFN